jgi:TolB protein
VTVATSPDEPEADRFRMEILDLATLRRDTVPVALAFLGRPEWSPDGEWLAFSASKERFSESQDIYLMRPDGSDLTQLTRTQDDEESPAWSPDGTHIAFSTDRDGNYEIYTMKADGTELIRLTNNSGPDTQPAWRP